VKRLIREHLRKRVIVTLKSGEAFGGVLFSADSEALVLREAVLLEVNGTDRAAQPVDGELLVLRADVAYLQFP
jgi:small nuclear ribonucleoprotein (snRNP)-like protein